MIADLKVTLGYFMLLSLLFFGCGKNTEGDQAQEIGAVPTIAQEDFGKETAGDNYSEAAIKAIIQESMHSNSSIEIDSFKSLHDFNHFSQNLPAPRIFNIDTLNKYLSLVNPLFPAQTSILGATDYLAALHQNQLYQSHLLLNKEVESHYGPSIVLVNIQSQSNQFESIVLVQEYFSEGYEYKLSSEILSNDQLRITKFEYFNTSNNNSKDDSLSVITTEYLIDQNGVFIQQ